MDWLMSSSNSRAPWLYVVCCLHCHEGLFDVKCYPQIVVIHSRIVFAVSLGMSKSDIYTMHSFLLSWLSCPVMIFNEHKLKMTKDSSHSMHSSSV